MVRRSHNSGAVFQGRAHYDADFLFADGSIQLIESTINHQDFAPPASVDRSDRCRRTS